ncbi:hypothetical protein, partial [Jannaschia sp. LMIT008]|uniref:hypothetical protein n=1 Tax=Jannaschia maritima TaxID=3032585 RepID=UPI00281262DD
MRALIVLAVVLGTLLPRAGAALAEVVPGVERIVICEGDRLAIVVLGPDGGRIDTDLPDLPHCVGVA